MCFNPHRSSRTGATRGDGWLSHLRQRSFNRHGPSRTGATTIQESIVRDGFMFQSSPVLPDRVQPRKPLDLLPAAARVSILTGPPGPVQRRGYRDGEDAWPVSILTGPPGPVQLSMAACAWTPRTILFQSSPVL